MNLPDKPVDLTRRRLLVGAGACAATALVHSPLTIAATDAAAPAAPLSELSYAQFHFAAGSVAANQAQHTRQILLGLDEDALLRPFRMRAGLEAPGEDLGGWYGTYNFGPGECFGQWMSALARCHARDGDAASRDKVRRLVRGYAATLDGKESFFRNNRFPAYDYDKLICGLMDAKKYTGDELAIETMARVREAALPWMAAHVTPHGEDSRPGDDFTKHDSDEDYTVPENQFLAWQLTGDQRYRDLGKRYLYDDFFLALARGENVLPGKHAYSHVNALSSAVQAYLSLGSRVYLRAAERAFAMLQEQSFATGGWGPAEHFVQPGTGALAASLEQEHRSFETPCGSFAHFKLTRYLLRITRDTRYGDSMEQVMYNTVFGVLPLQPDGRAFYYSDYTNNATKSFFTDDWPCCSGSLPQVVADYSISAYFTDPSGLYVNLYLPGQLNWRQGDVECRLTLRTEYPYQSAIAIAVDPAQPQRFAIKLRIPAWTQAPGLRVNGKPVAFALHPGSFAEIDREWRSGDLIELDLPLTMRTQTIEASVPDTVALLAGPMVLMRLLNDDSATVSLRKETLFAIRQAEPRVWQTRQEGRLVNFRAFADIGSENYRCYQKLAAG